MASALDVGGSDSGASSLPRSLGGVSGAGQSNLSTEVAALIQSEMASHHQRRQQQQQQLQNGLHHPNAPNLGQNDRESPDMDFLEMERLDFQVHLSFTFWGNYNIERLVELTIAGPKFKRVTLPILGF